MGRADSSREGRRVGGFDDDLQVGIIRLVVIERERVDVAFVGDQVEVGVDASLGRMEEAVVAYSIDDPEVFIAGGDLHDLLRAGQLNHGRVVHPGTDAHDVVGVVMDDAGGLLAVSHGRGKAEQEGNDR